MKISKDLLKHGIIKGIPDEATDMKIRAANLKTTGILWNISS